MENGSAPGGDSVMPQRAVVVGRDPELRALGELADRAVEDGAQVVFVSGEAGIGKSTLVSHFLTTLIDSRWAVHVGQCIEYSERAIPFGPVVSLIRSVLKDAGDEAEDVLGHHRADLAALLPEWRADGVDGASLSGDVDRLIDAISTVLMRAADSRPMALFVEDIHWADGPTRDVVASLVHTLGPTRILVVVSERTGAVPRGHVLRTWLAEQRRFPNVHSLMLEGLSAEALTKQAENILGSTPDPDLVAELATRTGGNAYFASELLLARRAGGLSLPTSLADFLTSRIEQLDSDEQEVLRAMAVAGHAIGHRILDAALPDLDIGPPVRRLFDTAMIRVDDDGAYDFGHALMRESMLRGVLPFEAEELHRSIAQAMEDDPARGDTLTELATVAMHWSAANDAPKSLAASVKAARASATVAAYAPATELAADALAIWPRVADAEELTGTTRDRIVVDASNWLVASNQGEAAERLLDDAIDDWGRDLPDGRRALLLAKLAPIRFQGGRPDDTTALLEQATALVGEEISPEAAQVHQVIAKVALLNAQIHPAIKAADRAIEIATSVGPKDILVDAMTSKSLGLGVTVSKEAGIELVHESRRRALAERFVAQAAHTFRTEMMIIYFREGRTKESLDVLREGFAFAEQHCGPNLRMDLLWDLALGLVEDGSLLEVAPILEDMGADLGQDLRSLVITHTMALSALLAGNPDEADELLASGARLAKRFSSQETGFQLRLESEVARHRGQLETALRLIDEALELQVQSDNITFTRESIVEKCRLVRAFFEVDPARAIEIRPTVEPLIDGLVTEDGAIDCIIDLMRLELALGDSVVEADLVGDLASRLATGGFGADAKQAAALHAQLLAAQRPNTAELAETLSELRRTGETSGMVWLCRVADELAGVSTSIDLTSTEVIDVTESAEVPEVPDHGLTPREVEVLGYLARGLTNKEIGTELYVSHRTVSTHVSNLLSKLHLKNRSEAASKFHELGFAKAAL